MAKVFISGKMVEFIMVNMSKIRSMAMGYIYGQMEDLTLAIGKKENRVQKEFISYLMKQ